MGSKPRLTGYRRENGTMGIRNHVIILPLDDLSNAAAEAVAKVIPGTMALPHAFGRLQFGEDLQLTFDTLIGTGVNANVAAVVVIGIEPKWTQRVADGIAKTFCLSMIFLMQLQKLSQKLFRAQWHYLTHLVVCSSVKIYN